MSSTKRRLLITLAILLLTVLVVGLLIVTRPQAKSEMKPDVVTRVEVAQVRLQDLQPRVELTGVLRPRQIASLRFEVSGELMQREVEPGARVAAGDLLMQLDDADYRDAVVEAESQLGETRAAIEQDQTLLKLAQENRDLAQREFKRLEKLGKGSLASASNRDSARQKLINLESELARLRFSIESGQTRLARQESALNRARRNLQRTRLQAPFDGRVNRVMVEVGDALQANTLALELIDNGALELHLEVSGDVAAALSLGQPLTVTVDGEQIPGELVALQFNPDSQTHTHPIRIRVPGEKLLPGELGEVALPLRLRKDALVVPASALLREEGGYYLFLVRDGQLERRAVTPGVRLGEKQAIRSGVEVGNQVVARDVDVLSDGLKVQIEPERSAP
ncbi:MAG: efflux RND transporter periplasmic adaptor subunit [Candidatus Thiodiazotropha sp.]